MRLFEFTESKKTGKLCILPGGFHIFSPGHLHMYLELRKKFPQAEVYIASSNVTTERPFPFDAKKFLAEQAGIPADKFVQVKNPYKSMEITEKFDPHNTILIFGISSKDKDRFGSPINKKGELKYLQPYPGPTSLLSTFDTHAYYVTVPAVTFKVLGQTINSASQVRKMYKEGSEITRQQIVRELYPNSTKINKIKSILDQILLDDFSN